MAGEGLTWVTWVQLVEVPALIALAVWAFNLNSRVVRREELERELAKLAGHGSAEHNKLWQKLEDMRAGQFQGGVAQAELRERVAALGATLAALSLRVNGRNGNGGQNGGDGGNGR